MSKNERKTDMAENVKVFHGSNACFENFENKFLGSAHGTAPINKIGFSFSSSSKVAKTFGKNIFETRVSMGKPYVIDARGQDYSTFKQVLGSKITRISKVKHDGIIIKNYQDAGVYGTPSINDHYIHFTESQIKIQSKQKPKSSLGFTLLETIVYIALFGLIFLAITNAIITFYQANRYTLEQMSQLDSARKGIAILVTNLREATYSGSGSYPVESAGNNNITFYSNVDADPEIERVRYFLNGSDFMRGVIEPTGIPSAYTGNETLATTSQYVRNVSQGVSIFQYYDTNGTLMSSPPNTIDVRYVKMSLVVNVNPATMPNEFTLRSTATLRNVKSNL